MLEERKLRVKIGTLHSNKGIVPRKGCVCVYQTTELQYMK